MRENVGQMVLSEMIVEKIYMHFYLGNIRIELPLDIVLPFLNWFRLICCMR